MSSSDINFENVIKGNKSLNIVDKLEELRTQLNSNSLKGRINKKELVKSIDEIIDSVPVEMRTAPSIVATSGTGYYTVYVAGSGRAIDAGLTVNRVNTQSTQFYAQTVADTAGRTGLWTTTNSSAYIAFSSEL